MHRLAMPSDPAIIKALGHLVIAHTQLELVMRYTVKTLSGDPDIDVVLRETKGIRMKNLRTRIRQLFVDKKPTPKELQQLNAMLEHESYPESATTTCTRPGQRQSQGSP